MNAADDPGTPGRTALADSGVNAAPGPVDRRRPQDQRTPWSGCDPRFLRYALLTLCVGRRRWRALAYPFVRPVDTRGRDVDHTGGLQRPDERMERRGLVGR